MMIAGLNLVVGSSREGVLVVETSQIFRVARAIERVLKTAMRGSLRQAKCGLLGSSDTGQNA